MKAALKKIFLFAGILVVFLAVGSYVVKSTLRNGNYYRLKPDTHTIVLGHSQPECGINDALIPKLENFSQGGESYFYTYQKAKKLLEVNTQVKTVIISYANNQIQKRMDDWVWDDSHLYTNYPKYNFMMDDADYGLLLKHNFTEVLKAETKAFKSFTSFMAKNGKSFLTDRNWGGFLHLKRNKVDSLLKTDYLANENRDIKLELSDTNIEYLEKIVALCKAKKVEIIFMRMPVHEKLPFLKNESQYQDIKRRRFADVELIDFRKFRVTNDEFGDFDHLNHKGAKRFSTYFNRLLQNGLLQSVHKQNLIDTSIQSLNFNETTGQ